MSNTKLILLKIKIINKMLYLLEKEKKKKFRIHIEIITIMPIVLDFFSWFTDLNN